MRRRIFGGLGVIVLAACAGGASHGPPKVEPILTVPDVYSGFVEIEGEQVPSTLLIRQAGHVLTSRMIAPEMGMTAGGQGTVKATAVELTMTYGLGCKGTVRLVGQVAATTFLYAGRITASDCTGDVEGSFSFSPDRSR